MARFNSLANRLRSGLADLQMPVAVPESMSSSVMTVAWGPRDVPTGQIVRFLEEKHGIHIGGGLGIFKDKVIRIGHMGPKTSIEIIDKVLGALKDFQRRHIHPSKVD
jgi:alanine-glyoxylate transaminase/serine-glyoxylate transaminase/serine-pyruvate transaminase